MATVIASSVRSSDIPARWGGEELAINLPKVNMEVGVAIAERIRSFKRYLNALIQRFMKRKTLEKIK